MSKQLRHLADLLPLLSARLRGSASFDGMLSGESGEVFAQLMALRADIALRLRTSAAPPADLLHLDAELAELESAFHDAASRHEADAGAQEDTRDSLGALTNALVPAFAERQRIIGSQATQRRNALLRKRRAANTLAFGAPFVFAAVLTGFSPALIAGGNVITPDGRTQTNLNVTGNVTDITTNTVQNGNGYNSFNQFQVGQQNTVNLHVPDNAQRLINVVRGGPVDVEGTLNGYKNGQIGGDVYFADPYGFVVGSQGAINVGSLTVRTPPSSVTEKLVDPNGTIDDPTAQAVIAGTTPISPDGAVSIQGRITAPNGVHIQGQTVSTAQAAANGAGDAQSQEFNNSVNTGGLQQGAKIVASNGNIDITSAGDTTIGGELHADGAANQNAGTVTIATGGNITLDQTAHISAKGVGTASNGGTVSLKAGEDLDATTGSVVDVSGGTTGNGGSIELSAVNTASFGSVTLDAGATSGTPGSVLIDPSDVFIGSTSTSTVDVPNNDPPANGSIDSDGGDVFITASDSITLEQGAYINTRQTGHSGDDTSHGPTGDSGGVTLSADKITIAGTINTQALNCLNATGPNCAGATTWRDGPVSLTASSNPGAVVIGKQEVDTSIDISGTINAGTIDVEANATAGSSMQTLPQFLSDLVSSIFGASTGYMDARASAQITVEGTVNGSGNVTFNSWTHTDADDHAITGIIAGATANTTGFVPAAMVGNVSNNAGAEIFSGANVSSGGVLTVRAHNSDKLDISELTLTTATPIDVSVAYTTASVTSNAKVDEGATISASQVNVTALNDNSFSTSASVDALGSGSAGITAAISGGETSTATAHFGPSLTLTAPTGSNFANQSLTVEAGSNTTTDAVEATTTVGTPLPFRLALQYVGADNAFSGVNSAQNDELSILGELAVIKFGAAIAVTHGDDQSSSATIGGDATQAPIISGKAVVVTANTVDTGVRSVGSSAVNSPDVSDATQADQSAIVAGSAGIAAADRTLSSDAEIGSGAQITAPDIGVSSSTTLPESTFTWLDGDSFDQVASHINGTLGVQNDVVTSFTDSTADANGVGISGSVDLFSVNANAKAFVGDGAILNSTNASGPWTAPLDTGDDNSHGLSGTIPMLSFDNPVSINAFREIDTINFGGNISIFFNGLGGAGDKDSTSFGADIVVVKYSGNTTAGVGDEAKVKSAGLTVNASAKDHAIDVSPAAGHGGGTAISGMVSVFQLGVSGSPVDVHASIASSADIDASVIDLTANQGENVGTIAGSLLFGNSNSVGAMNTTNTIFTDVKAYVGDNSADDTSQSASLIPGFTAPAAGVTAPAVISAGAATEGTFNVTASETGLVQSLAVSVDAGTNVNLGAAFAISTIHDNVGATLDGADVTARDVYVNANASDSINTIAAGASLAEGSDAIGAAGSSAASTIDPTIAATILDGSVVKADNNVGLIAFNDDNIQSIAGAAGIADGPAGVGLSVTVSQIGGSTTASITGADTVVDADADDASDTYQVNSGVLSSPPDVSSVQAPSFTTTNALSETALNVTGLSVVATSHQAVAANSATVGMSGNGIGLAIVPVTTIITSSATAFIDQAAIDKNLEDNTVNNDPTKVGYSAPDIHVIAGNQTFTGDFVLAVATSGKYGAGAGAVSTVQFEGTTKAYVLDSDLGQTSLSIPMLGAVDIYAGGAQDAATIVLGGAGGGKGGGAASLAITLFSADTEAYLEGGDVTADSLSVGSESDNGANVLAGGAGFGGTLGIGASVGVTINNDTTLAYIGDRNDVLNGGTFDDTALTLSGATDVDATTNNDFTSLLIAGAGGGGTGIAAMADVTTMSNTTNAGIYDGQINQNDPNKAGDVSVAANESDTIDATAGGGAVGGTAGVGGAANVVVLHSSVTGTILDSDIASQGAVDVTAEGDKQISAMTVMVSAGGTAGISGAVGVVLAGTDASSDVQGQVDGTLTNSDQAAPGLGVANSVDAGSPDTITASVSGGSMSAGGGLTIAATGKATTSNQAIGAAGGGIAGVGGSVAYTDIGDTVNASLDQTSPDAPSVSVTAQMLDGSGRAISTEADAGGAGGFGLGAGIAIGQLDDHVAALMNGSATSANSAAATNGTFTLKATDATSASSTAAGGAFGGVAVGAMVATASKDSNVLADTAIGSSLTNYSSVDIEAANSGAVKSQATGVAGGVFGAGTAAVATSNDDAVVNAKLGDNTDITGMAGTTTLKASDMPSAEADAYGVVVSDGVSLGASVAITNIDPNVFATIGDNVTVAGAGGLSVVALLAPPSGEDGADSNSFSGSGGSLVSLNGAGSTSFNNSDVEATTGVDLDLPDGDVGITATNTSNQNAMASGVGVGGIAGGAAVAESDTTSKTIAKLGQGASNNNHTGALSVTATGNDTDTSHASAGTYGLVTGNASVSNTDDNAEVDATVGGNMMLPASTITVQATHQDNYSENADSSQVSALGESGAFATHSADVSVQTNIDSGAMLVATNTVNIGAEEDFTHVGTDDSADAGGGGVANGASGSAKTRINQDATVLGQQTGASVTIGDSVALTAGDDPVLNPGSINIVADSNMNAADVVSLSTGGALEGAGVSNSYKATTDNTVTMGLDDVFLSFGNFNAGTYTNADVTAQALAKTWGILGAVADAHADVSLSSTQTVSLGEGSTVEVYGNANLTAGMNPANSSGSSLAGSAQAQSYVSGFVAVPAADSQSSATDDTSLKIASGAVVNAGENATVGAYSGVLTPADDAEGHGYEVGFIPVKDGDASDPSANSTQAVEIDGDVTAGAFNDLEITIPDCRNVDTAYCSAFQVSGNFFADAVALMPLGAFAQKFDPISFINQRASGADASVLVKAVSTSPVDAVVLGTLFASPGNVNVNADSLTGTGSLTANGSATIHVNNESPDYLVINNTMIPNIVGGTVSITGKAGPTAPDSITVTQNDTNPQSNVEFDANFQGSPANPPPPVLFVNNEITNLGGLVKLSDQLGSMGQFAPIEAQSVQIDVPQGTLLVSLAPGLLETTGASVEADWAPFMLLPSNNPLLPGSTTPDADWAIAYAVNAVFDPSLALPGGATFRLYPTAAALTAAISSTSNLPVMQRLVNASFTDGKGADANAFIVYGTCYPDFHSSANCSNGNAAYSPLGATWSTNWADLSRSISLVPFTALGQTANPDVTASASPPPASSVSSIVANTISINATYIDVDSDVTAGPPTNWSVDLPSSLAGVISSDQLAFQNGGAQTYQLPVCTTAAQTACVHPVGADDSLITVSYVAGATAADGQLVVNNVLASATEAASIKLDGGILSTNTLGHIHVNAGLGQVTIDNETSTGITVDNVVAGSADRIGGITGSVEIVDTLRPQGDATNPDHFWYEFTPGVGTTTYTSTDPNETLAQVMAQDPGQQPNAAQDFTFDPVSGLRWQWQEIAFMQRTVTPPSSPNGAHDNPTTTNWFFTDPSGNPLPVGDNDPWYLVDTIPGDYSNPQALATASNGSIFYYQPGAIALNPFNGALVAPAGDMVQDPNHPGQLLTQTNVLLSQDPAKAGVLLTGQDETLPAMVETITGTVTPTFIEAIDSGCVFAGPHCGDQGNGPYNGFVAHTASDPVPFFFSDDGDFDMDYITKGTVTLTTSVKADNPIAVSFSGATRGSVSITSSAPVTVNGQIENPNGDTTIDTTGGGLTTTTNGAIATQNLTLDTTGGTIGTKLNSLNTTQTHGGTLNASADEGVYIAATSALNIGQVASSAGDVTLTAQGDISRVGAPSPANVIGDNVTLTASHDGSVGSAAAPIETAATGTLNVTADGNIAIEQTQGNLNVGTIQSNGIGGVLGAVSIAVDNGALLDARNTTQAQTLSTQQQTNIWSKLKLTVALGGGIDATTGSSTVTGIQSQISTDYAQYWSLLANGSVHNGVFTLNPADAGLYSQLAAAAGETPQAYTAQLYNSVVGDFVQDIGADWQNHHEFQFQPGHEIQGFNANAVDQDYNQYWTLLANGTVNGGVFALNPGSASVFAAAAANAGETPAVYTKNLYQSVVGDFVTYIGANWQTQAEFQSDNTSFAYELQPGLISGLTKDPTQTEGQLLSALSLTAVEPSSGTTVGTTTPNVVGGTITLAASKGVGSLAPDVAITSDDLTKGTLTPEQEAAIALAKNPGSILFTGIDAHGNAVTFSPTVVTEPDGSKQLVYPAGVTNITSVEISQTAPLFVQTAGTFDASAATGGVFAQATTGDLDLGSVNANSSAVNLTAPGNILAAHGGNTPVIAGDDITLLAGTGNLGSAATPLVYTGPAGTVLTSASAGGSIYLEASGIDLDVGRISAGNDVVLEAPNGSIEPTLAGVALAADNLTLTAGHDIGTPTDAFEVQLGGTLNATAGGSANVTGQGDLDVGTFTSAGNLVVTAFGNLTAANLTSTGASVSAAAGLNGNYASVSAKTNATLTAVDNLSIGNATAGGTMTVDAGGSLFVDPLSSGGDMTINAGGPFTLAAGGALGAGGKLAVTGTSFTMGAGSSASGDGVTLTFTGAAVLGQVKSTFDGDHALVITANTITGNGDGQANIVTTGANAKTYLIAQNGIGGSNPLTVNTPWLSLVTAAGNIDVNALSNMTLADIDAPGAVTITGDGNLNFGKVDATGAIVLDADGNLTFGNVSTAGDVTLVAGGGLEGSNVNGNNVTISSGAGDLDFNRLVVQSISLSAKGNLNVLDLVVAKSVSLSAPVITANITQASSATSPLHVDITGPNGGIATTATLHIDAAANGVDIGKYFVADSTIITTASKVDIDQGDVTDQMLLITPFTDLYMNNTSPTPVRDVTEQFWAPSKSFFLDQDGTTTVTNAIAIDFGPDFKVFFVDGTGNVEPAFALVRTAPLPLTASVWEQVFSEDGLGSMPALMITQLWAGNLPPLALFDHWVESVTGEPAVNTNAQQH